MKKVKSLVEYLEAISSKKEKLSKPEFDMDIKNFWYRGQENNTWKLVPSLFRNLWSHICNEKEISLESDIIKKGGFINNFENQIDYHFQKQLYHFINHSSLLENRWIRYYLKQHYGLQTRLLDWTQSHLVALFFALWKPSEEDPLVWVMSPAILNNFTLSKFGYKSNERILIPAFHIHLDHKTKSTVIKKTENNKIIETLSDKYLLFKFDKDEISYPVAIEPLYFENRIYNQKSCFTVHGNKVNGFDIENNEKFIDQIVIDKNYRLQLIEELNEAGISVGRIFPDLTGFCEEIKFNFRERFDNLKYSL